MPPNVVLIIFDTARADAFEPYGARNGASPAFTQLASRGAFAKRLYAAASWTLPSHAAMFTGMMPRALGVNQISGLDSHPRFRAALDGVRERMLPEVLRAAGYSTRAVSANPWIARTSGFDIGFDEFVSVTGSRRAKLGAASLPGRARWALEGVRARTDDGSDAAARVVSQWLASRDPGRPFFWFVNLVECHSPYLPPRPYDDLGATDRLRAAEEARRYLTLGAIWKACAGALEVPPAALERMRHLYAASVRRLDDWLAVVLEGLESTRLLDETLVITTSDHGENLGEGGLMGHAFSLDDRLIRVPFAWAGPGAHPLERTASLVGLPAAIAQAAELESHPWSAQPAELGLAVAEFDPPAGPADDRVPRALDEWGLQPEHAPRIASWLTVATDGRWKLLRRDGEDVVYDLQADPLEVRPLALADVDARVVQRLRGALDAQGPARGPQPQTAPGAPMSDDERRRLEERMELLGYM